jgi:YebC/PmpR family DNA-binding regulatory protein
MSGHSKWSTIKHKKAATDAKRGKLFTKILKEITVAARQGGGDPEGNPRLRSALNIARAANMPLDNMKRAILRGTGEIPGVTYEEVNYEAYGPGGVAIYLEVVTDNRMRTTPEIRHMLSKHGGNLAEPNSVAWIFERKGRISVTASETTEETLMELVLEAGGDDLELVGESFVIDTSSENFPAVQQALEAAGIQPAEAGLVLDPQNTVDLDSKKEEQCLKLLELLDDHDDVQNVYANLEVTDGE